MQLVGHGVLQAEMGGQLDGKLVLVDVILRQQVRDEAETDEKRRRSADYHRNQVGGKTLEIQIVSCQICFLFYKQKMKSV